MKFTPFICKVSIGISHLGIHSIIPCCTNTVWYLPVKCTQFFFRCGFSFIVYLISFPYFGEFLIKTYSSCTCWKWDDYSQLFSAAYVVNKLYLKYIVEPLTLTHVNISMFFCSLLVFWRRSWQKHLCCDALSNRELTVSTSSFISCTTRNNIIANLTYFQLFVDCSALHSDWSAVLCDLCNWCNFRVFNFVAHLPSAHGCCRNNSILHNAVSSYTTVRSNFRFSPR